MIRVQVICDKCGTIAEIKQEHGRDAYMNRNLIIRDMHVSEINIDAEVTGDVEDIDDISDVEVTTTLQEVRISCRNCGDYIVLKEFEE